MTKCVIQMGQSGSCAWMGRKEQGVRLKKSLSHNNFVQVEKRDLKRWLGGEKAKDRNTRITHSLFFFFLKQEVYLNNKTLDLKGKLSRIHFF